jgi:DNA-binding NarL/FixJ family response regulator
MNNIRTIVVDDHVDFRRLAQALLDEIDGVELIGLGADGEEAIHLCEKLRPDLLLMDLSMPRMGGIQATRLIKTQDQPPLIAIVSLYDDAEHRAHAARAGAEAFINKADFLGGVARLIDSLQEGGNVDFTNSAA